VVLLVESICRQGFAYAREMEERRQKIVKLEQEKTISETKDAAEADQKSPRRALIWSSFICKRLAVQVYYLVCLRVEGTVIATALELSGRLSTYACTQAHASHRPRQKNDRSNPSIGRQQARALAGPSWQSRTPPSWRSCTPRTRLRPTACCC
jgi:hypothetical protein